MAKIYRQAVMAVIIKEGGRILIGYSPREKSFKFPQGGIEEGEDVIGCIKRELREELNYQLKDDFIIQICKEKIAYPFPPDVHPVFMGQQLQIVKIRYDRDARIIPQDDEFSELHWIFPSELKLFNFEYRADAYQKAMKICGLCEKA